MGEDKHKAFLYTAGVVVILWFLLVVIDFIRLHKDKSLWQDRIGGTRLIKWVVIFLLAGIISTLFSKYKSVSFYGNEGWYQGLLTQILMVGLYVIIYDLTRALKESHLRVFIGVILIIVTITIFLGFLNRFSIFPIKMEGEAEDYISTLGNINWYCGYWVIWTGIICGLFITSDGIKEQILLGTLIFIMAISGVGCGASSAYLGWMGISFVSVLIVLSRLEYYLRFVYIQIIALAALPFIRFVGFLRPHRMWYDSTWLKEVTYGTAWILPFELGIGICIGLIFLGKGLSERLTNLRGIIIGIALGCIAVYFTLLVFNTITVGGIWPVRGIGLFYWSDDWGNGRGGIWRYSVGMLRGMSLSNIIFGVGCDCFCAYAYSSTDIMEKLYFVIGDQYLTNAHNEIITMLINQGIVGCIAYIGLLVTHFREAVSLSKRNTLGLAYALAISGYIAVGLVGFMQVLSTPFLFLIMGMIGGLNAKYS